MELGLQIAAFDWQGGTAATGPTLARTARDAEAAGVARISVMDHFWQLGNELGPYEAPMLEAYTALGFIAAHTARVRLHTLVTGAVYREPAVLAKLVTTLDVLSGGRAGLGIGAAWFADEAHGLGLPFPPTAERFERLEETLQICADMWSDGEAPFEGRHYRLGRTLNRPQPLSRPRPYLLIGGAGEKKTLRLVARYADACNLHVGPETQHKLDVLRRHCDDAGRDYASVEKTSMAFVGPGSTRDTLLADLHAASAAGFTATYVAAVGETDPARTVELVASVVPEVREWP
ncbi:LLM class F420-dependent oxidoreductase [Nocardiopsis coralliicola]